MEKNICETYDSTTLQQLYKIITDKENGGYTNKDVFPVSLVQSIYDALTGTRLDQILALNNCIYVPFQGTREATRLAIKPDMRRKGLIIVFRDLCNTTHTQQYIYEDSVNDDHWQDDGCWEDCFVGFSNLDFVIQLKEYLTNYIDKKLEQLLPPQDYEFVIVKKSETPPDGYEYVVYLDEDGVIRKVCESDNKPIIRKVLRDNP